MLKRSFDLVLILAFSSLWIPLVVGCSIYVLLRLGRPVLFCQRRLGKNREPFTMIKFRSMSDSGTELLAFRKSGLDELPNLFNVIKGEMSLVGPRPLFPSYAAFFQEDELQRFDTLPGITGLSQLSEQTGWDWDQRLAADVNYVKRQSLLLDISILWHTLRIVSDADYRNNVRARSIKPLNEIRAEYKRIGNEIPAT